MSAPMFPRLVLFDLDGTLLDSAPDMVATVNRMRAARGQGPMPLVEPLTTARFPERSMCMLHPLIRPAIASRPAAGGPLIE